MMQAEKGAVEVLLRVALRAQLSGSRPLLQHALAALAALAPTTLPHHAGAGTSWSAPSSCAPPAAAHEGAGDGSGGGSHGGGGGPISDQLPDLLVAFGERDPKV